MSCVVARRKSASVDERLAVAERGAVAVCVMIGSSMDTVGSVGTVAHDVVAAVARGSGGRWGVFVVSPWCPETPGCGGAHGLRGRRKSLLQKPLLAGRQLVRGVPPLVQLRNRIRAGIVSSRFIVNLPLRPWRPGPHIS